MLRMSKRDFTKLFEEYFPTLDFEFIEKMNEIGKYGEEKYGDESFQGRRKLGRLVRDSDRLKAHVIAQHAMVHSFDAAIGQLHDKFGTVDHNDAAAAFNNMMNFIFRKAENEGPAPAAPSNVIAIDQYVPIDALDELHAVIKQNHPPDLFGKYSVAA